MIKLYKDGSYCYCCGNKKAISIKFKNPLCNDATIITLCHDCLRKLKERINDELKEE